MWEETAEVREGTAESSETLGSGAHTLPTSQAGTQQDAGQRIQEGLSQQQGN